MNKNLGNRAFRRRQAYFNAHPTRLRRDQHLPLGNLLPRVLRAPGKSRFLLERLRQEGLKHINDLYAQLT